MICEEERLYRLWLSMTRNWSISFQDFLVWMERDR